MKFAWREGTWSCLLDVVKREPIAAEGIDAQDPFAVVREVAPPFRWRER